MQELNKKTLLLVEDEALTAMLNKQILEKYGYVVNTVNSGEKAVDFINSNTSIDLILMDIDLGKGIDGTQAAEQILSKHDIPVVFLSSHTEPEVVEKTEKITSYGYVVKNSSITVLDASIKMAFKLFEAKVNESKKEAKLHENEQKFRLLHENAGIGIGYYSLEGIVLSYNQLAAKYMNGVPEDFIGKSIYDLFPKKDAEVYLERIQKAAVSQTFDVYQDMVPLLSGNKYFLSTFTKIQDKNEKLLGIQIISQDISDRKVAEEALRENKQKAELLLNVAAEIIIALDSQGDITLLNESGHKILGYESPELIDKNWFSTCLFREEKDECKKYFEHLLEDKSASVVNHESDVVTKYGERKTILWHNYILKNEEGKGFGMFSSGEDITVRQTATIALQNKNEEYEALNEELRSSVEELQATSEELQAASEELQTQNEELKTAATTLQESEEKYRLLYTSMDQGLAFHKIITDSSGKPIDYVYLDINESYTRLLGISREMAIGKRIREVMPKVEEYWIELFGKVALTGESSYYENYLETTGRYYSTYSYCPKKNFFAVLVTDITEQRQKQEEIKTYAARIELTMKAANIAWWEMDIPTGHVIFAKQKTDMLGYEPDSFKHYSDFMKLVHPDDAEPAMNAMRSHFSGQADKYEIEYRILTHDETYKWFYDIGSISTRDSTGKPLKVAGIVIDVTERKQEEIISEINKYVLHVLNEPEDFSASLHKIISHIKNKLQYDTVGIRLQDGDDFPYYSQEGFTQDFLQLENSLIEKDRIGGVCTDKDGKPCLECTCGLVLTNKTDPKNAMFTEGGSFWTNDSLPLLDLKIEDDPRNHPRNTCIHQKYFSVALIPIRTDNKIVGLLQINDFQKGRFTLKLIELLETIASYIGTALIRKQNDNKIKSLLAEKQLMLKEVHHRIKNNMSSIYSLLVLQAQTLHEPSVKDALNDAGSRIKSMQLLYEKLYQSTDHNDLSAKDYLPHLIDDILANFSNSSSITVEKQIDDFYIETNKLQPLGIIINELLTNIMKYAFIGRSGGEIVIIATLKDNLVKVSVEDNGNGMPESVDFDNSTGFGLVLVKGLTQQLGGTIQIERAQGTKIVLEFER